MKLFAMSFTLFGKPGDMEILVPAVDAKCAEIKLRNAIDAGKVSVSHEYPRDNPHTGVPEIVRTRETINGYVQEVEAMDLSTPSAFTPSDYIREIPNETAFCPEHDWHTVAIASVNPCRVFQGNSRSISAMRSTTKTNASLFALKIGYEGGYAAFSAKAKLETKLKSALKNVADDAKPDYEHGFRQAWALKVKHYKPVAKKTTRKKKETVAA
jgi:hypothetical protein